MEKKSKSTVPANVEAAVEAVEAAAVDMEEDVEAAAADMAAAVAEDMEATVVVAVEDMAADVVVAVDSAEDEEVAAADVADVTTAIKMATLPENAQNKGRNATRSILSIIHGRVVPPTTSHTHVLTVAEVL